MLDQAQHFQVPCILLNARLSEKSAQGYAKVPSLTAPMLQRLDRLLAQDAATAQRFITLGLPAEKSQVLGSIKFDIDAPDSFIQQAQQLKQDWNLTRRKIITLASTHAPEEQQLLNLLQPYLAQHAEVLCIVVPRHPERFDAVFEISQNLNLTAQRRSLGHAIAADTQVYLADSMGEMWLWYALSQVCFVGGSLNEPGGGHNILEPMVLNVPTVIGPNYINFQAIVQEFLQADALKVGQSASDVVQILLQCLADTEFSDTLTQQATQVLARNKGSLHKHIAVIDQYL